MAFSHSIEDYPQGIILPIDKPYTWTSADVIRKIKWAATHHFAKKNLKVGHAGTLDPLATGILLVCLGNATRKAEELQRSSKEYIAGITFGAVTPSYDLEKPLQDFSAPGKDFTKEKLLEVLERFKGEQDQVAPLFSAKSIDGVRAYEMARALYKKRDEHPDADFSLLSTSRITIHSLELLSLDAGLPRNIIPDPSVPAEMQLRAMDPQALCVDGRYADTGDGRIRVSSIPQERAGELQTALIRVSCSKGTYIRSLARDLGEAMGTGAFLSSLRRTGNGGFGIGDALSLEDALKMLAKD